jgi:hypothetical protein
MAVYVVYPGTNRPIRYSVRKKDSVTIAVEPQGNVDRLVCSPVDYYYPEGEEDDPLETINSPNPVYDGGQVTFDVTITNRTQNVISFYLMAWEY